MIGIWCFPWTDEKERKDEKRERGVVAYVVVGGFKISCGEWARLGLMSHTQRRPSKEKKNHYGLFYSREFTATCSAIATTPTVSTQWFLPEHRRKWARNRDEQIASPHGALFQISTRLQFAQILA